MFSGGCVKFPTFSVAADEEAFEDNSEEYIRRDLEGSGMYLGFKLKSPSKPVIKLFLSSKCEKC